MLRLVSILILASMSGAFAQDYTIDAPDEAHIRQRIDVAWTAADDTGNLIEIRPLEEGARRAAYSYVRDNPEGIEVPEAPGEYSLVFVHDGDVVASQALTVVMADAALTGPETAGAGEAIEIGWTGPASRNDQITWAERDGAFVRGTAYAYVQGATEGTRALRAPADAGDYDVIYRSGNTILARHPVTVGSISATLSAPAQIHAGGLIEVAFEGPGNSGDRLTFADRDGEARNGIGSYAYVANADGGSVSLRAGETLGEYDIVYVSNGRVIGRSPTTITAAEVTIDAPAESPARLSFHVAWVGAGNAGDMIRLVDEAGNEFDYSYIDPEDPGVELVAPETTGPYALVYRSRAGAELARQPITIVAAPQPPGQLIVTQDRAALGADDAVEIILDASGSMLQRLDGERRIEIARSVLNELIGETIPQGTGFALRVFGHREADSCRTDLEIPLAPLNARAARASLSGINAMNLARTPIADSIRAVQADLENVAGERILIVLTDGEETCDGDPAAAIQSLRDLGWDARVNIVGFAIDDADLERTFESWAAAGNGAYFSALDADALSDAMTRAVAAQFQVLDANGDVVASGITGNEAISLAPGDYRIVAGDREAPAHIVSDEVTTIGLD